MTKPKEPWHETVGWRFKGLGTEEHGPTIWLCTRYIRSQGFWMRLIANDKGDWTNRKIGDEACVSERAIGGTYHRIYEDRQPVEHEQPCECYVCRGEA